jgi:O-antigen/teichoic acid export membrane protein
VLGSGELLRTLTAFFGAQEKYLEAVSIVPLVALAPFLYFLVLPAVLTSLFIKKPEIFSAACLVGAVLNILLNLIIIPRYGALGAALTTVAAYVVLFVLSYYWMEMIYPVRYNWRGIGKLFLILLCALAAGWFVKLDQPVASLCIKIITGLSVYSLFILSSRSILSKSERDMFLSVLSRRRKTG